MLLAHNLLAPLIDFRDFTQKLTKLPIIPYSKCEQKNKFELISANYLDCKIASLYMLLCCFTMIHHLQDRTIYQTFGDVCQASFTITVLLFVSQCQWKLGSLADQIVVFFNGMIQIEAQFAQSKYCTFIGENLKITSTY